MPDVTIQFHGSQWANLPAAAQVLIGRYCGPLYPDAAGVITRSNRMPTKQKPLPSTFASRLKAARERTGLSKNRLARLVGLNHSVIGKLESGDSQPMLETARRLAAALGVPLEDLAGDGL